MKKLSIAILHYSAPPLVGGVESVILAHSKLLVKNDFPVLILAGEGNAESLPKKASFIKLPLLNSQHPQILQASEDLEQGMVPQNFGDLVNKIMADLSPLLQQVDLLIVHNVFSKHFNLPLTAALFRLLDTRVINNCIAWGHDFSWTSVHSSSKVRPGYPWDLLRTYRSDVTYITVSKARQLELAALFKCLPQKIRVIYNGVDEGEILRLSKKGLTLINRLGLLENELNIILPVRITQAKNMELAFKVVFLLKQKGVGCKLVITGPPDPHDQGNLEYLQALHTLRTDLQLNREVLFVYEMGPQKGVINTIEMEMVAELMRVSDILFMPSHREGFGMPILEAGLAGIPIFCSNQIPSAQEIGESNLIRFSPEADADEVAKLILDWKNNDPVYQLRSYIRRNLTWNNLFKYEILPLLEIITP